MRGASIPLAAAAPARGVARTARQGVVTLVDQGIVSLTNFLTGVIVARSGSAEELGLYAMAFGIALLLTSAQTSLVSVPYNVYWRRVADEERAAYAGGTLVHQLGLALASSTLLAGAAALAAASRGGVRGMPAVLAMLAATIPFSLAREYGRQLLFSHLRFGSALRLDAVAAVAQIAGLLLLSRSGALSAASAYAVAGVSCAVAVALWAATARRLFALRRSAVLPTLRMNWATARWTFAAGVVTIAAAQLYPWFVASSRGAEQAGVLGACMGITALTNPLLIGMGNFLPPRIMHAFAEGGLDAVQRVTRAALVVFSACMAVICPVLFLAGGELLRRVYGASYGAYGLTVGVLSVAIVADWLSLPAHQALFVLDRAEETFKSNLLALGVTVTLGFALVAELGVIGAAVGLLVGNSLSTAYKWWRYRRRIVAARLAGAVAAAVLAAGTASARDLHVDGGAPAASDENDGTSWTRPLATISAAVARAAGGDTVWIASGTYRERLELPRGGDGPRRRLRVAALDGARVDVKASDVVTGWIPERPGIWKRPGWRVNSQQVFADGRALQQIGATSGFHRRTYQGLAILAPRGRGVDDLVPGSFSWDAASTTLYVRLHDDGDPNARLIEASVRDVAIEANVPFVELRGLAFSHSNASDVASMRAIVNVHADGWIISGCAFTWGDFAGLSISGTGHRVLRNVASHNGNVGIVVNGSDAAHGWEPYAGRPPQDIVLDGNETSFNNTRGFLTWFQAGGLKGANSCTGIRISRHVARSNAGPGLWFDLGCQDVRIEDSVLDGNTVGIYYEISDRAVIARNRITGSSEQGIYVSASNEVSVHDNVLDGNRWGVVLHGLPRGEHPELKRNAVRGNVIARSGEADLVLFAGPGAEGNTSDRNVFVHAGRSPRLSWTRSTGYVVTHDDLGAFARDTGHDRHSSVGAPGLLGPAASARSRAGAGGRP